MYQSIHHARPDGFYDSVPLSVLFKKQSADGQKSDFQKRGSIKGRSLLMAVGGGRGREGETCD